MKELVSVVVPLYDEAQNIELLVQRIQSVFDECAAYEFECLLVNDGSTDATQEILDGIRAEDGRFRPLHLCRNYGQSAAIVAGMRRAQGDYLLMLDGDLQNDPADFPRMLELLQDNDCVCGYRVRRQDSWVKRQASAIANAARRAVLHDGIRDAGCGTKGFRRRCVEHMIPFNGMHRYFGVMMQAADMRIVEMEVAHHPRLHGRSKYGVWDRLWRGLYDLFGVAWLRRRYVAVQVKGED